ncbi:PH domain-containing protein [Bacillus sp. JCM 19034]|uniref:PH domain-containing protein n=1 Tax=Bacillus sp. JCM 19034 TaxID=1481928 RepID=UPI000783486C|nr:PH domain-containing protein [Bacillus sp. JCM 19034]
MHFPSKKDIWLNILMFGIIVLFLLLPLIEFKLITIVIVYPLAMLMIWFWIATSYTIEDGILIIRYGPFSKSIKVKHIQALQKSKSLHSAPAMSIDRIEIRYNQYDTVYISPQKEKEFVETLLKENPTIQLDHIIKNQIDLKKGE